MTTWTVYIHSLKTKDFKCKVIVDRKDKAAARKASYIVKNCTGLFRASISSPKMSRKPRQCLISTSFCS